MRRFSRSVLLGAALLCPLQGWTSEVEASADIQKNLKISQALLAGKVQPASHDQLLQLLTPLAEEGNPNALLLLGKAYRDGLAGIEKHEKQGFQYLQQAAGKNGMLPEAQFELGKCYFEGVGTDRNLISAYLWTTLSLEHPTPAFEDPAEKQQLSLKKSLTAAQLAKANELVNQMKSVYLVQ